MSESVAREIRQELGELITMLSGDALEGVIPAIQPEARDDGAGTYEAMIPLMNNAGSLQISYKDKEFFTQPGWRLKARKEVESGQEELFRRRAAQAPELQAQWKCEEIGNKTFLDVYADLPRPKHVSSREEVEMLASCAKTVWRLVQELSDPATISRRNNQALLEKLEGLITAAVNLAAKSETSVSPAGGSFNVAEAGGDFAVEYRSERSAETPALAILWRNGYIQARARASRSGFSKEASDKLAAAFLKDQSEVELANTPEEESFSFATKLALPEADLPKAQPEPLARKIAALCGRAVKFAALLAENPSLTVETLPISAKFEPFRDFCLELYKSLANGAIPGLSPMGMNDTAMKWGSAYQLKMEISLEEPVYLLGIRFAILSGAIYWELYGQSYGVAPKNIEKCWKSFATSRETEQLSANDGFFTVLKRYRQPGLKDVDAVLANLSVEEALPSLGNFYADFLACVEMLKNEEGAACATPGAPSSKPEKSGGQENPEILGEKQKPPVQTVVDGEIRRICGECITPFKKFVSSLLTSLTASPAFESLRPEARREPSLANNRLSIDINLPEAKVTLETFYNPETECLAAGWQGKIPEGMAGMCRRAWRHLRGDKNMKFALDADEGKFRIFTEERIAPASLSQADAEPFAVVLQNGFAKASQIAKELERHRSG